MDRWKAEQGRGREKRKFRRERVRRKKMQMREKVGKSRFTVFFQWFVVPEGRKVGSLKRRVRRHMGRWDMKNLHAVVARSTFPSQNAQNTRGSDHFWRFRCRKSARRCGAKHIPKSKCTKHTRVWPLLEVAMSHTVVARSTCPSQNVEKHTKCGPLLALKMSKKCTAVVARSTFPSQNVKNTRGSDHFWRLRGRVSKKCTPLWHEAHFEVKMLKTLGVRTTFGGSEVEFRKSARRCGTKHTKSKC